MSRPPWLDRLQNSSRSAASVRRDQGAALSIRQLERRRVLDAAAPAIMVSPSPNFEGEMVTVSTDSGAIDSPQFDWTVSVDSVVIATGNEALFKFTPPDNGNYTIDLLITDASANEFHSSTDISVRNVAPQLTAIANTSTFEGAMLHIEDLGTIRDAGFDNALTGSQETFNYLISWGDGHVDAGNATVDQVGSAGTPTLASFDAAHIYADNGVYTVRVTAIDDDGGRATRTFQVTVGNQPPVVSTVGEQTVVEGTPLVLPDIATISDPGFINPAIPSAETFTYSIDWGDGTLPDTGSATIDQLGRDGQPTTASIDGQHTYVDDGTYKVTITVVDDDGGIGTANFNVSVLNSDPVLTVAGDQSVSEGSELTITDIGVVSDAVFIPSAGDQINYSIDWGDGTTVDTGTATIDQLGSEGQPTLASFDGTHTYADNGTYTVTIHVDDGDGGTDSGTLSVTVKNVAPTLTVAEDQTLLEGQQLTIVDLGSITDPGFINSAIPSDETFTYTINWGDGTSVDAGTATIDQLGSVGTPTMASFDGSHTYADNGIYTVTVTVADDDGGMATDTFSVTVGNVAPTLTVAENQLVPEGTQLSIVDIGTISDPAFHSSPLGNVKEFTYTINWGDGTSVDAGTATIDQLGSVGTPTMASFDGSHTYADNGIYTVTVTVADDDGGMATDTFSVTVGNVAPTLTVAENQLVPEGTQLSIVDIGTISDPAFHSSPLGNVKEFTYTINWGDGTSVDAGTATIDQLGSVGTPTMASFDGSHTYADNGIYTVTVTVADDDGGMATDTFSVTVGNVAPTLTVANDRVVDEGSLLSIANIGTITDPGFINSAIPSDETFTYTINWGDGTSVDAGTATIDQLGNVGTPTMASFDGSHTYADNGIYTVTVTVADDDGGMATDTFSVTVGNVAPTLTVAENQLVPEGTQLSIVDIGTISDPAFHSSPLGNVKEFTYTINWGDGTSVDAGTATIDQLGSVGTPTMASFDGSHTYADNGIYTVTVTVADDDGGMATDTFSVTVGNVAPTLTVANDRVVDEGSLLSIANIGTITDPGFINSAIPSDETFTYTINWGDGTSVDAGTATIDQLGSVGTPTMASFDGSHTYADNGIYKVTVTVADDDGGMETNSLQVIVENVAPMLTGVATTLTLDEGQIFTLADLGVALSDPGFDNLLNTVDPSNGGELTETFIATTIDWGDGSLPTSVSVVNRVSGLAGVFTTAGFDHVPHAYADNGTYTVIVNFADDDGGAVSPTFTIDVHNVAPTLTLSAEQFTINEGDTLTIPLLGTFTDPGYNNLVRPSGASSETFTYEISWGDGTATEVAMLPASVTDGRQGVATAGTLADSHLYADNDIDNRYTITVKLSDDDGGFDQQSFDITVLNVAPTLLPIAAIDVTSDGTTELTLTFTDPGTDEFEVLVAWGENQDVALEDRWVVEVDHTGATPATYVLTHRYTGPPNPDAITADIPISVVIRDDDFSSATTLAIGQSNIETVLIGQPGTEDANFAIDTTPEIPVIEFPRLEEVLVTADAASSEGTQTDTTMVETRGGEVAATSDRYFRLHVVMPDGRMLEGIRLPDDVLDDLPALFAQLPDNHYRIYLVQGDNRLERLVLDVVVRDHRPVDPSDASDGTRDRPPTDEAAPADDAPNGELFDPQTNAAAANTLPGGRHPLTGASAVAAAALVLDPKTDWAVRLDRAFARADRRRWQTLRRRRPR